MSEGVDTMAIATMIPAMTTRYAVDDTCIRYLYRPKPAPQTRKLNHACNYTCIAPEVKLLSRIYSAGKIHPLSWAGGRP